MTRSLQFLRYLDLDEDADERAIRRAYARRLKQIDQATDPEAFQALREAYEAAIGWAHCMQHRAQATAHEEATPEPAAAAPLPRLDHPDSEDPGHDQVLDAGAMAQPVLDELLEHLVARPPGDASEAGKLLERALDDPRLLDLDGQFLFEWSMASIFAHGWKPGHEFLFAAAMMHFAWREDRGRLVRLGRAGQFIDLAIDELEQHDQQPDEQRASQRDLIHHLRQAHRPSDRVLIKNLSLAEELAQTWPYWLHVITDTQNIAKWREWETEVPRWRRVITLKASAPVAQVPPPPDGGAAQTILSLVIMAVLLLSSMGRMLGPSDLFPQASVSFQRLIEPSQAQPPNRLLTPSTVPTQPTNPAAPAKRSQERTQALLEKEFLAIRGSARTPPPTPPSTQP